MNCIFICVFNQIEYVDMLVLLMESIFFFGKLDDNTSLLIYTSTSFMELIKRNNNFKSEKVQFEINDTYNDIYSSCRARLDFFRISSVYKYNKILYLDTDILVKGDINRVFDVCKKDILYALGEGQITNYEWGDSLFGEEASNYPDKTAFSSGILLFYNCEKIKTLFMIINEDMTKRYHSFYDQPYIVYNAFKYNLYNNTDLKAYVANNDENIFNDIVIHHFPSGPGIHGPKINVMTSFLSRLRLIKNPYIFRIPRERSKE